MAALTRIRRVDVRWILPRGRRSVVATCTVARDAGVTEGRRGPRGRVVARIALCGGRDMIRPLSL